MTVADMMSSYISKSCSLKRDSFSDILPTSAFQNLISERTEDVVDSNDWKLSFVARYKNNFLFL